VLRGPVPVDVDGETSDERMPPREEQHERTDAVRGEAGRPAQIVEAEERLPDVLVGELEPEATRLSPPRRQVDSAPVEGQGECRRREEPIPFGLALGKGDQVRFGKAGPEVDRNIQRLPERHRAAALHAAQLQEPDVSALRVGAIDIALRESRMRLRTVRRNQ
jgi:hypothetical protein